MNMNQDTKQLWEDQSKKGIESGTRDLILDALERKAILSYIKSGSSVLEIGCGDGRMAVEIKQKFDVKISAFDYANGMINVAKEHAAKHSINDINFFIYDLNDVNKLDKKFDIIVSKRTLINLNSYEHQIEILKKLSEIMSPGAIFLMCESSKRGLANLNKTRAKFNLKQIEAPWHNVYTDDDRFLKEKLPLELVERNDFSSTYYFLSRVVNAHVSHLEGREPAYDSPINKIALEVESFGDMGQTVLWVWRKN